MDLRKWHIFAMSDLDEEDYKKIKFALVFGIEGEEEVQYVTDDDEVWTFGKHYCDTNLEPRQRERKMITELKHKLISDLCSSVVHSVALTENGTVYTWGEDLCAQGWGTDGLLEASEEPRLILKGLENYRIKQIACGSAHTLALSEDGLHIIAWGHNECGQIGNGGKENENSPVQVCMNISKPFVQIGCRDQSSFALNVDGVVFAWGQNMQGELGIGHKVDQLVPEKVKYVSDCMITKIACGYDHTLALNREGVLYAWGRNCECQIGVPGRLRKYIVTVPVRVAENIGKFVDIAATPGSHISAAMTEDSRVYMWGECRKHFIIEPMVTPYSTLHEVFAHFSSPTISYKAIPHVPDPNIGLLSTFEQAFKEHCHKTGDLMILIKTPTDEESIRVHSFFLKIRCPYFTTLLQNIFTNILCVQTTSPSVYKALLQYLYTGVVNLIEAEHFFDMIPLAEEYDQRDLIELCKHIIIKSIGVENAFSFYAKAHAINDSILQDFCLTYITEHLKPAKRHFNFTNLKWKIVQDFLAELQRRGVFLKSE